MGTLFSSFAKIVSILLMLLYSYGLFRNLSIDYREGKKKLSGLLYKILLLLHFISYAVLYFQTGNLFYIYFYLPQLLYFLLYPLIWKKLYPFYNEVFGIFRSFAIFSQVSGLYLYFLCLYWER